MSVLVWDAQGERKYETGLSKGVLYPFSKDNGYKPGVAWNGLTGVTETPSGAESNALYADNIKYLNLISAEEFSVTIEAYMYPDEFKLCDGSDSLLDGLIVIGQQPRKTFGLSYQTIEGNDTLGESYGVKYHLVYGCLASPSERAYTTTNDSPDAVTFSWEVNTTPVNVSGKKATAIVTIDGTLLTEAQKKVLEEALYGTETKEAYLPTPDELATLLSSANVNG